MPLKQVIIPYSHTFKNMKEADAELRAKITDNSITVTHRKPTGGKERITVPLSIMVSLAESLVHNSQTAVPKNTTPATGYRVVIKPSSTDFAEYAGQHGIITERSTGGDFAVLVLKRDVGTLVKVSDEFIEGEVAWINQDDMVIFDTDVAGNMAYFDKYKSLEEYACPDCGYIDEDVVPKVKDGDCVCGKCGCEW